MATTRIIPMHQNKGKTIRQCLSDRLDYGKNPDKTQEGQLISAYACDPETADAEFALSKREYYQLTGRRQDSNVIAYQVRQSFRPGEITPEEANRIGYEFAERFLKGNHAFIVCTHTDKQHIHNHIYWNSTSLDCTRKFRNFWGSTMAVRKLSDLICVQHRLSVIENPKPHGISYNRWQGDIEKLSNRDRLCLDMDAALAKKPHDLDGFYSLMEQAGYTVTRGKNITFSHPRQKRNIRMRSLPEEYREDAIREVLAGRRIHNPRRRRNPLAEQIFRLRIQGLCNSAIADRLNSMGILSPMEYKQAQGFNYSCGFRSNEQAQWSPMLVKRILSNEIYIGTLIQHKSGTPNHKIKKRVEYDRDEWIVIENNHEPIICRSDFDTVQNLMLRDVRTAPKQEKVHLFSGFVFCGDCKHTMVRKTVPSGGKKYRYLVCSTNKAGKGCSPHTFSEDKLKSIVLRVVNDHIELIAQVEQVLDYIASLPEQERRIINYDAQMTALENEIKRYQDLKINLYSDMADGVISREEYKEFHAGYDRRIADRQRQLGKLKDERSQAMENSSGNIEWIEQFKKYRHLTELDRECIVHLIEKILIYDGKRIEVCFRYRDELENALQYIERFEDVLPAEEGVTIPERRNA